ncbi:MAG: 30S ribosomal protein S18 [Flavobacteriales endosymbiont of Rhyzopertha dominica]|nr:MAG: 30S ribosomal protein S18 [Candidatus Shikimatogenerans bostrichidophilus]
MKKNNIKYLSPIKIDIKKKKRYCYFKKNNIKYIDYKNPKFLIKFLNEFGKILPRRITGVSKKYQILLNKAIKRCRHIALLPFVTDNLK